MTHEDDVYVVEHIRLDIEPGLAIVLHIDDDEQELYTISIVVDDEDVRIHSTNNREEAFNIVNNLLPLPAHMIQALARGKRDELGRL